MKRSFLALGILLFLLVGLILYSNFRTDFISTMINKTSPDKTDDNLANNEGGLMDEANPLTISALRAGSYQGSDIVIEETLDSGSNYNRYLTSYRSEGLKIYALLTVPSGEVPESGWPVVIFNHGYIPPREYRTTERYIAYVDGFARSGYIVFRPDYRGHGNSEGNAAGGYGSNAYTIDVLNALSSVKKLAYSVPADLTPALSLQERENKDGIVDPNRMGMWGHSMGGFITLRSMVVTKDIKAGVIWAGVVGSFSDMINNWRRDVPSGTSRRRPDPYYTPLPLPSGARRWRERLVELFGDPSNDSPFWQSISANFFLKDISGPLQLHHGTADASVPESFSQTLAKQMKDAGKEIELYMYKGDDHNLSANFNIAMQRSIEFFDKYLK